MMFPNYCDPSNIGKSAVFYRWDDQSLRWLFAGVNAPTPKKRRKTAKNRPFSVVKPRKPGFFKKKPDFRPAKWTKTGLLWGQKDSDLLSLVGRLFGSNV